MTSNLFLHLCEQAEANQSYALANYLTWRSHQAETGYRAQLWNGERGLELLVSSVRRNPRRCAGRCPAEFYRFDLSDTIESQQSDLPDA